MNFISYENGTASCLLSSLCISWLDQNMLFKMVLNGVLSRQWSSHQSHPHNQLLYK